MSFKVFLSYSLNWQDQALVWRLQTLAAAHRIEVYVPPREGSGFPSVALNAVLPQVRREIDEADCVLAIITDATIPAVEKELSYALGKNKVIIPIVQAGLGTQPFFNDFARVFEFSPWESPGRLEGEVVEFLKQQQMAKEKVQAIGALVAIGVGLLLLLGVSKE